MYQFKREDNGEIVEVDFAAMMEKDALGIITLPDGGRARQVHAEHSSRSRENKEGLASSVNRPIVSDALGFPEQVLADFEADRQAHGFSGVEFVRDPDVPQFIRPKCSSPEQWQRYIKHRGARDQNSLNGSGAGLTREQLRRAEELVLRERGEKPLQMQ